MMTRSLIMLLLIVGISACGGDTDKRYKFLETISVSGTCGENHANIKGEYNGFITKRYGNIDKRESIYGIVNKTTTTTIKESIADRMYQYKPPVEIEFTGVPIEIFNKDSFSLGGHSKHYPKYTLDEELKSKVVLMYYSTCKLEVTNREVF